VPTFDFSGHRYVVSFSGGIGSFLAAAKTIEKYGKSHVDLVFCDTLIEDEDLYRFLDDAETTLGVEIIRLKDGRTPWDVFRDERLIGDSRVAPCSKFLKRKVFARYLEKSGKYQIKPKPNATIVLGIDWTEEHRFLRAKTNWEPWPVIAPLCEEPLMSKTQAAAYFDSFGVKRPRLYEHGFAHNNCGGFCVRAGQAHFANLLKVNRERYLWHEGKELEILETIPRTKPFLKRMRNGILNYMTLQDFRVSIEGTDKPETVIDKHDFGGCGCFVDDEAKETEGQ
jgi:3'-phosphoadenosine 5'-phosphosulfate sulfotransferase (PAPS reductase)/FAD synthetase